MAVPNRGSVGDVSERRCQSAVGGRSITLRPTTSARSAPCCHTRPVATSGLAQATTTPVMREPRCASSLDKRPRPAPTAPEGVWQHALGNELTVEGAVRVRGPPADQLLIPSDQIEFPATHSGHESRPQEFRSNAHAVVAKNSRQCAK